MNVRQELELEVPDSPLTIHWLCRGNLREGMTHASRTEIDLLRRSKLAFVSVAGIDNRQIVFRVNRPHRCLSGCQTQYARAHLDDWLEHIPEHDPLHELTVTRGLFGGEQDCNFPDELVEVDFQMHGAQPVAVWYLRTSDGWRNVATSTYAAAEHENIAHAITDYGQPLVDVLAAVVTPGEDTWLAALQNRPTNDVPLKDLTDALELALDALS